MTEILWWALVAVFMIAIVVHRRLARARRVRARPRPVLRGMDWWIACAQRRYVRGEIDEAELEALIGYVLEGGRLTAEGYRSGYGHAVLRGPDGDYVVYRGPLERR